jgi:hypothetical protein
MEFKSGADAAALFVLAKREVECCPFFRFTFELDDRGVAVTVAVPLEAVSILQDFALLMSG